MLKINLLGKIYFELDGTDISSKISSKSAAIIAILLLQEDGRISRRELLGFLWPESTEDAAKYNLRYNLWQIKKAIPPVNDETSFIESNKDYCFVNNNYEYVCDLKEIIDADIDEITSIPRLEELLSMCAGEFFENQYFTGCHEFEELILMQKYYLDNKKLNLHKRLIDLYYKAGNANKCLDVIDNCQELDPFDENNALIKIKLLIQQEKYGDAISYYHKYYSQLARELGIKPPSAITNLVEEIKPYKNVEAKHIKLSVRSSFNVEGYWMADFIRAAIEIDGCPLMGYMNEKERAELSEIQFRLGPVPPKRPSAARIVGAFVSFVTRSIEDGYTIEITTGSLEDIDDMSVGAINVLQDTYGNKFVVR